MKKFLIFPLIIIVFAGIWSCNNDLDVNDDWKEVPVVYGLLDQQDSIHIIKITKAFLGEGNALFMAQIPDSSYYGDELVVQLVEIAPEGWFLRTWDLDTIWIHNKNSNGDFFSGDQMLYAVKADLEFTNSYMVTLQNLKTGHLSSANTQLIRPLNIVKPRGGQRFFSFTSIAETQAEFQTSANGRVYQLAIRFHYKEVKLNSNDTTYHYIDWVFPNRKASNLSGSDRIIYSFSGSGFYSNISSKLKADENIKRIPGVVDFIAYAGGDELSTYIDITSPFNSIVQERPEYSNVNNGIGIFSSRTSAMRTVELTPASIDSLVNGSRTWTLGFVFP